MAGCVGVDWCTNLESPCVIFGKLWRRFQTMDPTIELAALLLLWLGVLLVCGARRQR